VKETYNKVHPVRLLRAQDLHYPAHGCSALGNLNMQELILYITGGLLIATLLIFLIVGTIISNINYLVGIEYLRIRVWGMNLRKFSIADFSDVVVGVKGSGENWTTTINIKKIRNNGVSLHRKSGLFRRLNITPVDPEEFVEKIKSHPRYHGNR